MLLLPPLDVTLLFDYMEKLTGVSDLTLLCYPGGVFCWFEYAMISLTQLNTMCEARVGNRAIYNDIRHFSDELHVNLHQAI